MKGSPERWRWMNPFAPLLDRPLKELDPVERALLRLASYEMQYRIDIPIG